MPDRSVELDDVGRLKVLQRLLAAKVAHGTVGHVRWLPCGTGARDDADSLRDKSRAAALLGHRLGGIKAALAEFVDGPLAECRPRSLQRAIMAQPGEHFFPGPYGIYLHRS